MKRIGILSDTHGYWDDRYASYFADCDEIWHAGDVGDYSIIKRLAEICPVKAVCGNIDHGETRRKLVEIEIFECEGIRVLMTHIGGYPGRWSKGMKSLLREKDIGLMVDGHSHILKVIYDKELRLLHINPGAAGQQGWHRQRTLVRLTVDGTDMRDCEIIELSSRSDACKNNYQHIKPKIMNEELKKKISEAVEDFAANDGAYSDDAMLEINPADMSVRIVNEEEDPSLDYYDMMDLVEMDPADTGRWNPFTEAIDEIAGSY